MPRDVSTPMLDQIETNFIRPAFLADITFASMNVHCWTGAGNITYNGNTYLGVGSFGSVGRIIDGSDVQAYGTTLQLSGIDTTFLSESMTDIQLGAPIAISFALLDSNANVMGNAYPLVIGTVDQPAIKIGTSTCSITLAVENKLSNLQRANMRRYTAADQQLYYPGDTLFNAVEYLNDLALIWN